MHHIRADRSNVINRLMFFAHRCIAYSVPQTAIRCKKKQTQLFDCLKQKKHFQKNATFKEKRGWKDYVGKLKGCNCGGGRDGSGGRGGDGGNDMKPQKPWMEQFPTQFDAEV